MCTQLLRHHNYASLPPSGDAAACACLEHTSLEAALRLGDISQACVRGALQLVKPGQVLLLSLGPLLRLQGSLQR